MGFATALSGLKASQTTLSVTGNNIANSQTAGFKESRAQFGDVYTSSLGSAGKMAVGSGVRVSSVAQQFKQGNIEATGNALDLAISGDGFFAMGDLVDPIVPDKPLEATSFTRNGAFHINDKGNIVDDSGRYLLGFKPTGTTVAEGFDVGVKLPLKINTDQGAPQASTNVDMKLNLNGAASPAVTPFSFLTPGTPPYIPDPKTYTHTTSITTYDSLGNAHIVSSYFCKTAVPDEWDVYSFVDGRSLQPGVQEDVYAIPPVVAAGAVILPAGTITSTPTRVAFDDKGALSRVSPQATALDTASSEEALALTKLNVAKAQVETDLTTVSNSVLNVNRSYSALITALDSQISTMKAADPADTTGKAATLQTMRDSLAGSYGDPSVVTDTPNAIKDSYDSKQALLDTIKGIGSGSTDKIATPDALTYDSATVIANLDSYKSLADSYSSIKTALDTLKRSHASLVTDVKTAVNSQVNSVNLGIEYDGKLNNLNTQKVAYEAVLNAQSAAGKPIERTMNTKIDFGGIDLSAIDPKLKASPLTFSLNLAGSTQFSNPFTVNDLKQNGLPVGNLTGVDVDKHGVVYAKYSNGFAKPLGQVAMARFPSNQDLAKVGNTTWLATSDSGAPIYGAGGDNNFGTIQSSAIENSNVDLSEQLVKLIVAQQAYQANSQTVTTEKSLIETMLRI